MDQLDKLLAGLEVEIQRAFREAIADVVDNVILKEVIEALQRRDVDAAFRALGVTPPVFNPIVSALRSALQQTGSLLMLQLPRYLVGSDGVKTMFRFNIRDERAENWLRQKSSGLITNIENDMRTTVRNTLQEGLAAGRNPRTVALDIVGRIDPKTGKREGGVIGLGEREEAWSRSARRKLLALDETYFDMGLRDKRFDGIVRKAIDTGKPLSTADVDKLVDRYRARALKLRGDTIGRTEAHEAMMYGEWLSNKQAVEAGNLREDAIQKVWDARNDDRTRHSHAEMDGQRVGINEPFVSPVTGAKFMFPGDRSLGAGGGEVIACRCRVRYDIDFLKGVT